MGDDATRELLKKQLEYYLGDSNLRRDKFIQKIMDKKEGYADLATICKFNKMKSISTDRALIKTAVEASDFLELNADGTKIRRKDKIVCPALPNDFDERNVYVENLPKQFSHDSVRKIFDSCGKVLNVSIPRHKDTRKFKGFAFIEFATKADIAKAVAKNEYSEQNAKGLRVITKLDWLKIKGKFKDTKVVSCARPKDFKKEAAAAAPPPKFHKGSLLRVTGIGDNASRFSIEETVATAAEVRFVDYFPADGKPTDTAIVRFCNGSGADSALKYFTENPTKIGQTESSATFTKVPDDEELAYYKMLSAKTAKKKGGRNRGRNKRFDRTKKHNKDRGSQKRARTDAEAAPAKRNKTE